MSLATLTKSLGDAERIVIELGDGLARRVMADGRLSRPLFDQIQPESIRYARHLAQLEAARALIPWAEASGDFETRLAEVYLARALQELANTIICAGADYGATAEHKAAALSWAEASASYLSTKALAEIGEQMLERDSDIAGKLGDAAEHAEFREMFARFSDEQIAPQAEAIHRKDKQLPEELLEALAELGVFGISIPEEYGGSFIDHITMCLATEELSRGSLGAGGSVITRPEIASKAILKGGTEEQKQRWLPAIAAAERLVSVAVTEPNAGSDVASVGVTARKVDGGYLIDGEKTWATFAGRADTFCLLARTGETSDGHRGLTLFLAEKPSTPAGPGEYSFKHEQDGGGRIEGHAIPTIGYRGMHSYSVTFESWFVPDENRIGEEGKGFILQMQGFAGGRIQTAARAVGVMEAAFRSGVEYAKDRKVFGRQLASYTASMAKLVEMAATLQASRQLSYHVARLMDDQGGDREASLVKLLSCKDAEWVTREAMQLHGGMGYSEEYAVSRYWVDARVLSIFEGAEEVLALYVIARPALQARIKAMNEK